MEDLQNRIAPPKRENYTKGLNPHSPNYLLGVNDFEKDMKAYLAEEHIQLAIKVVIRHEKRRS